jgi:hypothetical protein
MLSLNYLKKKRSSWAVAGLSIVCITLLAMALKWITITPGDLIGYAICLVGIVIFGVLSNRYEIVDVTLKKFFFAYLRFFGWLLITLGPLIIFTWLSRYVLSNHSFIYQLIVFAVWGTLLAWALLVIFTDKRRERFFSKLRQLGSFTPIAYAFNLLMIAVTFFSSVTYVLVKQGIVTLGVAMNTDVSHGAITDFYLWHFLDAIPVLEVNKTLHWDEPLTYKSGWIGFALLVFKLLVILPVIAAFAWHWKQINKNSDGK